MVVQNVELRPRATGGVAELRRGLPDRETPRDEPPAATAVEDWGEDRVKGQPVFFREAKRARTSS